MVVETTYESKISVELIVRAWQEGAGDQSPIPPPVLDTRGGISFVIPADSDHGAAGACWQPLNLMNRPGAGVALLSTPDFE